MLNRFITFLTLASFISYLCGCSSLEVVQRDHISEYDDYIIKSIITKDGQAYDFISSQIYPAAYIANSLVIGWHKKGDYPIKAERISIPVSKVKSFSIEEDNLALSLGVIAGVLGIAFVILVAATFGL